jgi:hypothetical protein
VDVIGATSIASPSEQSAKEATPAVQKSLFSVMKRVQSVPSPKRAGPRVR